MWKKALSLILILTLSVSVIWFTNPVSPITASAENFRYGFSVVPEKEDETGVAPDSGFILTSEKDINLEKVRETVSIRDVDLLEISRISDRKFLIKPLEPLKQNKVYYIDIKTDSGDIVTFAFQTKREFKVLGTLPADTSGNVPPDTGIEIYFSYPDVENIEKFFEISPKVDGRFENHGYTTVFIPKNRLQPGTIYEITVKKGLTAANGLVALEDDYVFAFETSPDSNSTADPYPGYLSFEDSWIEFGTAEKPVIPFSIHLSSNPESVGVNLSVYRFRTIEDFVMAIKEREEIPSWAYYTRGRAMTDTSKLEKVMEFSQNFNLTVWQSRYMMFPESLPHGHYLLELSCGDLKAQAFMQISDISAYAISDKDRTLLWLNDIKTGKTVSNASIYDYTTKNSARTDRDGLAVLPARLGGNDREEYSLLLYEVTTSDQRKSLINAGYVYRTYTDNPYGEGLYWRYLQTDRTLYKPSDTVEFWGFIRSRTGKPSPDKVTVELYQGGYYYPMKVAGSFFMPFISNALETLTLDTENGFFEGSLRLPNLDPGYYSLQVKDGDNIISSSYFSVENYVKPQYRLEISSDKKAVFTGEEIVFEIKASFFEGTPVSNVPVRYSIQGYGNTRTDTGVTDENGILKVGYTPEYTGDMQGQSYFSIYASAEFPETGNISAHHSFYVFANDITFSSKGEIRKDKGIVTVTVNEVELETLNDDDPQNDSYIGKPVSSHKLSLSVEKVVWERIETGTEYDPINKVVRKLYEYREKNIPVTKAYLVTDEKGTARFQFQADPGEEGYYVAKITTQDGNGRNMKDETWIYNTPDPESLRPAYYEYYSLETDKEAYRANEPVNVKVLKNGKEPLEDMRTLFVQARNGIQDYLVKDRPELTRTFPEDFAPNYYLYGIVFNGRGYIYTNANIRYDYEEKRINLGIKTDRESYKPGDNVTLTISATDINGNHVPAKVNLSLVDEALLELSDQHIDPLAELYSWIGSGILRTVTSRTGYGRGGSIDMVYDEKASQDMAPESPRSNTAQAAAGQGPTQVRSDFRDTALFKTITLGSDGSGVFTFRLPDNITSFRLTAAAISEDLFAGSAAESVRVSMPFFINDAMSPEYLEGDKPYIGLSAYGEELKSDETVTFEVTVDEIPGYRETVRAKAFERVYVKLPDLTEGSYKITVRAVSENGLADALGRTILVRSSFRTIEKSVTRKLASGIKLEGGQSGITTIIFADAGRGSLINSLHGLAWQYGNRLDQKLTANHARKLLKEIINNEEYIIEPLEINYADYRNKDGGYGILPYAESDLRFASLVTPLLKDVADASSLKLYFYNELLSGNGVKAPALFALAELGEPVLVDLNKAAAVQNLKLDDYMFIALAYNALGDYSKAQNIYTAKIRPLLETKEPYMRVKVGEIDSDTCYGLTALAAVLAARLDSPDAPKLFAYVENNYSKINYVGVEKVLYLAEMSRKLSDAKASVEYSFGNGPKKTADLSEGYCEVIKIPSINMETLKILKVTGDVNAISLFTAPYTEAAKNDPHITVSRKYCNAATGKETNTFKPNDIVRVEISYNIDKAAIDNIYEVRDYAPAGLKPLSNPWRYGVDDYSGCWYRNIDGQEVTFVVGKPENATQPLVYYARVAGPGEYIAEGTVVQGSMVKSSMTTLENARIIIEPQD